MNILLKLSIALTFLFQIGNVNSQELNGSYKGTLEVQGMQLELFINISPTVDGYTATMDVSAQGASGIELDSVVLQENQVTITSAKMQLTYTGTVSGEVIEGTYEQ